MHTDTIPKVKPTGDGNPTAGHTDNLTVANSAGAGNTFANLAVRFALAGHTLTLSNPANGAVMYYATRWGLSRALPDLQAVGHFLAKIGGGHV